MKHLLLFAWMIATLPWLSISQQQIVLKEIASTNSADQTPFVGIDGLTVHEPSLYVVDRVMQRVAVLQTKNLHFQSDYSQSYNPDASLSLPGFITVTSKNIFVADFGRNTIRIFTPAFKFVKKIVVYGAVFGIAADANEEIWIASVTPSSQQTLKKIDASGNILAELSLTNATGSPMELYYNFCIDNKNNFYVAYFTKNCIEVLRPEKGFIRQFMVPGLPLNVLWKKKDEGIFKKGFPLPEGLMFSSIATDNNGHVFILTGDYSETPYREVDICSPEGAFLGWCVIGEKAHLISTDNHNHLFSIEGNKNQVKMYELKSRLK